MVIFGNLAEIAGGYLKKGSNVYLDGARAKRKATKQQGQEQYTAKETLCDLIQSASMQRPTWEELRKAVPYDRGPVRDVYYFLLQQGELIRVSENIVLSPGQITFLQSQLKESFPKGHTFTVPEFKELFGISRKYAIPFLEFLDRKRITRRIGDKPLVL